MNSLQAKKTETSHDDLLVFSQPISHTVGQYSHTMTYLLTKAADIDISTMSAAWLSAAVIKDMKQEGAEGFPTVRAGYNFILSLKNEIL